MKWIFAYFSFFALLFNVQFALADTIESLTKAAEQNDPVSQYELARHYELGTEVQKDAKAAFYWYLQSAVGGYDKAKLKLSKLYIEGKGTQKNIPQGLFWLIDLAMKGNTDAQLTIGKVYQSLKQPPDPIDMAEVWYQIASGNNPAAEEAYSKLLESKFNARRAKQMSYIEQLNSIFPEDTSSPSSPTSPPENLEILSIIEYVVTSVLVIIIAVLLLIRKRKKTNSEHQKHSDQQSHEKQLANQAQVINQQKKQLSVLYRELKKQQERAKNPVTAKKPKDQGNTPSINQLQLACTLFGFRTNNIPDEKKVKLRFKQLSKVYHPDVNGSEEEMKRLNAALKIILSKSNK
ncbi:J domain-containing protein [Vibrio sp. S4M6]|uniref:J domain-containing protein n=1 Tax=Vibrio sinus TaxID=2946865 RepID=UPI00202A5104|nr:J domain-containing protein [Vibrio sinus]MCL9783763.1 J domain-containing protein [Vibrio sinus]